jgi:replication factor C subunit 1
MLSIWKLYSNTMDFDEGKDLYVICRCVTAFMNDFWFLRSKMNEKYSILSPFDVTSRMLGPYLFSTTARETLGDKMELYFHDHSFIPLFIQASFCESNKDNRPNTMLNRKII